MKQVIRTGGEWEADARTDDARRVLQRLEAKGVIEILISTEPVASDESKSIVRFRPKASQAHTLEEIIPLPEED
jgi:hypothetical protein